MGWGGVTTSHWRAGCLDTSQTPLEPEPVPLPQRQAQPAAIGPDKIYGRLCASGSGHINGPLLAGETTRLSVSLFDYVSPCVLTK